MRLEGKIAVIVGAGQSPGEGIGNGRATTLRFAQEGARILAVDRLIASAEETAAMATQGGECVPFAADVTKEETLAAAMEAARARWQDAVGANAVWSVLQSELLGESDHCRFGRLVGDEGIAVLARSQRRNVDDGTGSLQAHDRQYVLASHDRAAQVDRADAVERLLA